MIVLIIIIFFNQFVTLAYMYSSDRRLQWLSDNGVEKTKMITLTKHKYFFVFYRRKRGLITMYIFKCMLAYYIINFWGVVAITIQYFAMNDIIISAAIVCGINLILLHIAHAPSTKGNLHI